MKVRSRRLLIGRENNYYLLFVYCVFGFVSGICEYKGELGGENRAIELSGELGNYEEGWRECKVNMGGV